MRSPYPVLVVLCACFVLNACKPGKHGKRSVADDRYLYQDVVRDSIFPPGIAELTYTSSGSKLFGFEYIANGKGPHPTVILVHANPGNERNLDIAQSLRRAGYNVFYFDYRGSWGSEGTYSYANCIGDTRAVIDYVTDPANRATLRVDSSKIFLVGHNLGAGIALIEGLQDSRVKGVAALSLVNPYTTFSGGEAKQNFTDMYDYFASLKMLKMDAKKFLLEIVEKLPDYHIEKLIAASEKPVLVVDEQGNNKFLANYRTKSTLVYEVWDTDLEFSDKRIAITKKIKSWLDKQLIKKKKPVKSI